MASGTQTVARMDKITEDLDDMADQFDRHGNIGTRSKFGAKRGLIASKGFSRNKISRIRRLSSLAATNTKKRVKNDT